MFDFYQDLPQYIDPNALSFLGLSVQWYSLMWLCAFVVGYLFLIYRVKKREGGYTVENMQDLVANSLIGALVGGRIGYVIFYDIGYYFAHPLQIISPYNFETGVWIGIYGMSYHGGLIGVILAIIWTARKMNTDALRLSDFIVPVVPIAYFFGRIGNFLNGELFGRITSMSWGMHFDSTLFLRHPSQLYEAFFEGIALFSILWYLRNRSLRRGVLSALYLIGYAFFRFFIENFREPDEHLGTIAGRLTMGQVLSLFMMCGGIMFLLWIYRDRIAGYINNKKNMI